VPRQADELFNTIRLRWLARKAGFEKLILKNARLICYFVSSQESPYYKSDAFQAVLRYIQQNPASCRMKENESRLSLTFKNVNKVGDAIRILNGVLNC
jgi:transcription-repair coupling factor (superfamily II helicase)